MEESEGEQVMKEVSNKVLITNKSYQKIQDTYTLYVKSEDPMPNKIDNHCIVHTYVINDTIDEQTDSLNGYADSLFFNIKIFDCIKLICYESIRTYDGINLTKNCNVRTFKDLSTMYIFRNGAKFIHDQCLEIY